MYTSTLTSYLGAVVLLLSSPALGLPRPIAHYGHHLRHPDDFKRAMVPLQVREQPTTLSTEAPQAIIAVPSATTRASTIFSVGLRDIEEPTEPTTTITIIIMTTRTQTQTINVKSTMTRTVFGGFPHTTGESLNVVGINGNGQVGYFED